MGSGERLFWLLRRIVLSLILPLVITACALLFAGTFLFPSLEAHGPMDWRAPAKERKVKNPIPNTPESRSRGEKIYMDKCAACHGLKGDGQGEMGKAISPSPSDFTDRHMMKEMTDGEMYWKISMGRGAMPSYRKELAEKERWDVVNYIKSFAQSE